MRDRVAFDVQNQTPDGAGGADVEWSESYQCAARLIYSRGSETIEAARLEGRSIFKVKIRSCAASRQIQTDWRMRDLRRGDQNGPFPGTRYNIREVDAITDRRWVYLVVESGVAV